MPLAVIFFIQKSSITDVWLGSKCASDSIQPSLFLLGNNKYLPVFIFFATAFHALVTTSFYLYLLSCLLNSTGYCFTFSHNITSFVNIFLYFIFICKNVTANDSAFNYLSVFFEVFLFHEITWTKYQKVLIFSSRYFMK